MSETIERVGKAIYLARFPDIDPAKLASDFEWFHESEGQPDSSVHYSNVAFALRDARAAIEALRFPAGASSVPGGLAIEESMFGSEDTVFHGAAKSFNAILDAALATPAPESEARYIAILQRNDSDERKEVPVPVGQSLEFDEGSATRRWLWPHLGTEWHLVEFRPSASASKTSPLAS